MRLPWDEVRDYFHDCDNYIGSLDTAAEKLAAEICGSEPLGQALEQARAERHGVRIAPAAPGGATAALRRYAPATRTLRLASGPPVATRHSLFADTLAP